MSPTVMQFCIRCVPAIAHIAWLSVMLPRSSVNDFGNIVCMWCIIALKCATSASGPLHYMKSTRWLSTTWAICWADLSLTSDVITAKAMREWTEKQSLQTLIISHFWDNKKDQAGKKKSNITQRGMADGGVIRLLLCIDFSWSKCTVQLNMVQYSCKALTLSICSSQYGLWTGFCVDDRKNTHG